MELSVQLSGRRSVPLIAQDRVIGALTVSRRGGRLPPRTCAAGDGVRGQAAVAIRMPGFDQRGRRHARPALARIASQLTLDQPMKRTLAEMAAVREATGALCASPCTTTVTRSG
jgi:hypothetical protein